MVLMSQHVQAKQKDGAREKRSREETCSNVCGIICGASCKESPLY